MADYLAHTPDEVSSMLAFLGLASLDELFAHIPAAVRLASGSALPAGRSEPDVAATFARYSLANRAAGSLVCFAGGGAYDHEVPAVVQPGDVVFFGGHVIHRSHRNRSKTRFRRSFVSHYSNARSYTEWNYGDAGGPANHFHILARGNTHLPFGKPQWGTPCAALQPPERRNKQRPASMMPDDKGDMAIVVQLPGMEGE